MYKNTSSVCTYSDSHSILKERAFLSYFDMVNGCVTARSFRHDKGLAFTSFDSAAALLPS